MPSQAEGGETASSCHSSKQEVDVARWKRGVAQIQRGKREAGLLQEERRNS